MVKLNNMMMVLLVAFLVFLAGCTSSEQSNEENDDYNDSVDIDLNTDTSDNNQEYEESSPDEVVAIVNGEKITSGEVINLQTSFLNQGQQLSDEQALNQIISNKLLEQEASDKGFGVSVDEAESFIITELSAQNASLDDYKMQLESMGASYEDEVENLRSQLAIEQYLDSVFVNETFDVSDDEALSFYDEYKNQSTEEVPVYEDLKQQIIMTLQQQKQQEAINNLVTELLEEADVEY